MQKIKIEGEWKNIVAVYKKVNNQWVQQDEYDFDNIPHFYSDAMVDVDTLLIIAQSAYSGMQFYVIAKFNGTTVTPTWSITSGNQYATIDNNGKVTILEGANNSLITVNAVYNSIYTDHKDITVTFINPLRIVGQSSLTGELGNVVALYNNQVVNPVWSITSGNQYATISQFGEISIIADGTITVQAEYQNCVTTKTITVVYDTNQESQTTVDPETGAVTNTETSTTTDPETGATIETTTTTTTNTDGSSSESTSETTTNTDGSTSTSSSTVNYDENGDQTSSTSTTTTVSAPDPTTGVVTTQESTSTTNTDGTSSTSTSTVVEHTDGSSTSNSSTTNYDENGNPTGSTTNTTQNNADGSSSSSTTNFDENGDPTDQQNQETDTTGNVNTQDVEYENGSPVVTGYTIDTTASEGEGKSIEGNGINTEFVPFKFASEGFILHIVFETRSIDQPRPPLVTDIEDTSTSWHYTILGAKATALINGVWPGFEIRWTIPKSGDGSNGALNFGRTLSGERSSTRTTITNGHNGQNVYDITVTYNPSQATHKFVVYNNYTHAALQDVNKTLQNDVDLDLTIGYSFDHNGDQMRHANVIIHDFSVSRLS